MKSCHRLGLSGAGIQEYSLKVSSAATTLHAPAQISFYNIRAPIETRSEISNLFARKVSCILPLSSDTLPVQPTVVGKLLHRSFVSLNYPQACPVHSSERRT